MTLPVNVLKELWDLLNDNIENKRDPDLLKIPLSQTDLLKVFLGK